MQGAPNKANIVPPWNTRVKSALHYLSQIIGIKRMVPRGIDELGGKEGPFLNDSAERIKMGQ